MVLCLLRIHSGRLRIEFFMTRGVFQRSLSTQFIPYGGRIETASAMNQASGYSAMLIGMRRICFGVAVALDVERKSSFLNPHC